MVQVYTRRWCAEQRELAKIARKVVTHDSVKKEATDCGERG
jgi:hypothetical protein